MLVDSRICLHLIVLGGYLAMQRELQAVWEGGSDIEWRGLGTKTNNSNNTFIVVGYLYS